MSISKARFVAAIWLATVFPIIFFVMFWSYDNFTPALGVKEVLVFLGAAHVPATLMFYRDPQFKAVSTSNPLLLYGAPIVLTIAGAIIFPASNPLAQGVLLCGYWCWQAYHYGKQNVGVHSFTQMATSGKSIDKDSKLVLVLLAWVSTLGTLKVLGKSAMPEYYFAIFDELHRIGFVAYILISLYAVWIFRKNGYRIFSINGLMYFTLVAFFAPLYLAETIEGAFLSYAVAHALQYLIFMAIVADGAGKDINRSLAINVAYFVLIVLVMGTLFAMPSRLAQSVQHYSDPTMRVVIDTLVGAVLGATIAHFVIDAYTWKLSRTASRQYILHRFRFIFAQKS